jgi:hypothetical protein
MIDAHVMPALPTLQAKDAGLLDNKDVGGANKRRKTADGGGLATGRGEEGEGEGEEEEEEEDEEAFLRRALESDEIDEETIKVGGEGRKGEEGRGRDGERRAFC